MPEFTATGEPGTRFNLSLALTWLAGNTVHARPSLTNRSTPAWAARVCILVRRALPLAFAILVQLVQWPALASGLQSEGSELAATDARLAVFTGTLTAICVVASVVTAALLPRARGQSDVRLVVWKRCLAPSFAFGVLGALVAALPLAMPSMLGWMFVESGVDESYLATTAAARACHALPSGVWLASSPIVPSSVTVALEVFAIVMLAGSAVYAAHLGLRFTKYTMYGRASRPSEKS